MTTFKKAKKKAEKKNKSKEKKWYHVYYEYHGMKCHSHILLMPLAGATMAIDHLHNQYYESLTWSEEKATKVLDKTLPKVLEYVPEDKAYYFPLDWNRRYLADRVPIGTRTWADKFCTELLDFLEKDYVNKKYNKTIEENEYSHDKWIKFVECEYINGKKDNQVVTGKRLEEMNKNIPEI